MFADKLEKKHPSEKEIIEKLAPIIRQLVPWGSDAVIKSFVRFRDISTVTTKDRNQNPIVMFHIFEQLLINIRKDLGHNCKELKKGDLLRLFITDYDKYTTK
jgi:hypothetical protein